MLAGTVLKIWTQHPETWTNLYPTGIVMRLSLGQLMGFRPTVDNIHAGQEALGEILDVNANPC